MPNLLDAAVTWLDSVRATDFSHSVTWKRGTATVTLNATFGATNYRQVDDFDRFIVVRSHDFIISPSDLILSGSTVVPEKGDVVEWLTATERQRFRVLPFQEEPVWRFTDAHQRMMRVHSKRIDRISVTDIWIWDDGDGMVWDDGDAGIFG